MLAIALFRAMRPRQWVKNILVLAAPLAAGDLFRREVISATALAFVVFSLAASGVYLINDVCDRAVDRLHPNKRHRPIAAGQVPLRIALVTAALLLVAAVVLAASMAPLAFTALILTYVAVQVSYSLWLKHQPVIDLAAVGSGFLMRAMAGGLASRIPLSQWFLLVAAFGSLFVVAGKRYSELQHLGAEAARTRPVLRRYSPSYLRFVWSLSAGVAITTYGLWAFEISRPESGIPWAPLSIAPFVLALLRYAVDVDTGLAEEPEEIVFADRVLLSLGLVWLLLVGMAVFP